MFAAIWEYEVRAGCEAQFLALYGGDGAWVALFRGHEGYIGTELLRDAGNGSRFVTIDRWESEAAYEAFLAAAKPAYARIDAQGDALTAQERAVGRFTLA